LSLTSKLVADKMDTHIADDKLKELHVEDTTVKANRDALQYEIDPAAEKKLLRKIDIHVVPILWFVKFRAGTISMAVRMSLHFALADKTIQVPIYVCISALRRLLASFVRFGSLTYCSQARFPG